MRHQSGNDTTQLRRRLEECPTLPTLPAIAMELLDHLGDPDLDLETTATLIQRDPALAASVLRFVNSPYWGVSKEVKSLAHAIALLGINAIHTLALSFSLVRGLKDNPNNSFDFDHYWRKSILTGALARAFGVSRGVLNLEQLFLAGLLQDIGMLALQSLLPEAYGEMSKSAANNHSRLCQLEREALGVDHAHVGAWLAELWGLPEGYLLAIRESHDFDLETVPAALRDEVECVFLAGCLADIWLNPDSRDEDIWKKLLSHTNETTLESITADVQEWFSKLSHLFRVPVLDSARADQVLLEAREQLAEVSLRNLQRTEQIERERQRLAAHNLELRKGTFRDALTGLYNRAYLEDIVTESYRGLAATKGHISVLFCDVNRFKDFNDTYGHKCGDEILAAVGQANK